MALRGTQLPTIYDQLLALDIMKALIKGKSFGLCKILNNDLSGSLFVQKAWCCHFHLFVIPKSFISTVHMKILGFLGFCFGKLNISVSALKPGSRQ